MYYSKSTFCRVLLFRRQSRWTVSLSGHSCHVMLLTWTVMLIFYALHPVWDVHCQNVSCAKETDKAEKTEGLW